VVREVMTPRPDISACSADKSLEDVKNIIIESGHSRIPIYENNLDNIIGMIYAKDLLKAGTGENIKNILRPAVFIPEAKKVDELLHEMQTARTHLAIIVDEFGVSSGLVTLEDLIEEIVGEIHDEFEREEKMIDNVDKNTFIVDGRMTLKDLNDELRLNLPEEEKEYDTIGGFVFSQLGRAPSVGQVVRFEDLLISIERVLKRRITRVKITIKPKTIEEEAVGG
ncbi:MAG: hemolysin family protein, partial [Candidatus Margulisiibacteriota bacterium]